MRVTMLYRNQLLPKRKPSVELSSQQILKRFADPIDCLTAHLMLECSEVLAGVKPANLLSLVNRTRPCGRNLYQLWQAHHEELIIRIPDLTFIALQTKPQALLLLCYNHRVLDRHLSHAGIRILLQKAGYDVCGTCEALIGELQHRIINNTTFPHEIGLFIGYPAKDVAAFMGMVKLKFTCQGPWKIYGNPVHSLALADQYRCCRNRMSAVLASGSSRALELDNSNHPFFCHKLENDNQYLMQ